MGEIELQFDASTSVAHFDAEGLVPTTASLTVYKPDGTALGTYAATLSTISTTCDGSTSPTMLDCASVAGMTVGAHLAVTSDGVTYVVRIARIDGLHVHLESAIPVTVDHTSPVKGLTMTASVTAPGVALIGSGYRLVWTYSNATTSRQASYQASVVRWRWTSPVSGADVRSILANSFQERKSESFCDRVAELVNDRIKGQVQRTGRRPWLYLSPYVFAEAARQGVRYTLAEEGIYPGGDAISAVRELRFAFDDAMSQAIRAAQYDADATGQIDGDRPTNGGIGVIQAVR